MPLAGRHELPPLTMGDLSIAADELLRGLGGAGVMTEGDFEALIRMEVTFARKKGEYYACYEFGTAITPDSDQMTRIGTLAMVRLLLRCGSFRACYSKLSEASAAALRRKVAEPSGFAGLELEDTGYETLPALVAAVPSGWLGNVICLRIENCERALTLASHNLIRAPRGVWALPLWANCGLRGTGYLPRCARSACVTS